MRQLNRVRGPLLGVLVFALVSVLLTSSVMGTLSKGAGDDPIRLTAVFEDASGLRPGDEVRIAGVRVGRVDGRELVGRYAHVSFSVDAGQPIRDRVRARISYLNLLGQRYIALERGGPGGLPLKDGDLIPVRRTAGALDLTALFNAFRPLFDLLEPRDVNGLAREVVAALQGEGPALTHLLQETGELTSHIAGRDQVIDQLITNLTLVMETTADHRQDISRLVDRLSELVSGLAADRAEVGRGLVAMRDLARTTSGLLADAGDPLTHDVARLRRVGEAFNANSALLGKTLQDTPVMLESYGRAMGYGGWLNTYICSLSLKLPDQGVVVSGDAQVNSEVCR